MNIRALGPSCMVEKLLNNSATPLAVSKTYIVKGAQYEMEGLKPEAMRYVHIITAVINGQT